MLIILDDNSKELHWHASFKNSILQHTITAIIAAILALNKLCFDNQVTEDEAQELFQNRMAKFFVTILSTSVGNTRFTVS